MSTHLLSKLNNVVGGLAEATRAVLELKDTPRTEENAAMWDRMMDSRLERLRAAYAEYDALDQLGRRA